MVAARSARILGQGSRATDCRSVCRDRLDSGLVRHTVRRALDRLHAGRIMPLFADLISYFENSALADNIRENDLLFPLIESVHVVAICLVVGSILAVDLRLLGIASINRPVSRVTQGILPLTWGAFVVAITSGGLLFISNATKYLGNGFFVAKMFLIGAAGLNMVIFHMIGAKNLPRWENDARLPLPARLAGGVSILLWIAVVACGRWIGFTMRA